MDVVNASSPESCWLKDATMSSVAVLLGGMDSHLCVFHLSMSRYVYLDL